MAKPLPVDDADAADRAAGFDTKPSYTLKTTVLIETAGRCCAWTQGPTEARAAYVFRMMATAYLYPEALALFYDVYWRLAPVSDTSGRRTALKVPLARGSLLAMLSSRYGSITPRVAAPGEPASSDKESSFVVFRAPFFRGPPLGDVKGDDMLIAYIKESDKYAYGVWKEACLKVRANAADRAYFDTAASMLEIMMSRSLYEPAVRYASALDAYYSLVENYVEFLQRTPPKERSIGRDGVDPVAVFAANFFARPPDSISDETRQFMAAVAPPPGSAVAADVDRQAELLAQFDMPSLYIAAAMRGVVHDGTARSNNQTVAMLVDLTGDAVAVCLGIAPRPIDAARRAFLSRILLPVVYSADSDAMRRDMLSPWHVRVQATPIVVSQELARVLPTYGTIKSRILAAVAKARIQVERASRGKKIRRAGHDKRFDTPDSEVAKTRAHREEAAAGDFVIAKRGGGSSSGSGSGSDSGSSSGSAKKRRNEKKSPEDAEASKRRAESFAKRKEKLGAQEDPSILPPEPASESGGNDDDSDDDEGRGDRLRALSLFASARAASAVDNNNNAAILAAFPPGYYDSIFPANNSAAALAALPPSYLMPAPSMPLDVPSASSSSGGASVLSHLLWGSSAKSDEPTNSPSAMDSSPANADFPPLPANDQGGVVEMDADDQPPIPTPRANPPDEDDSAVLYYDTPDDATATATTANKSFVPPTPNASPPSPALRESYFFAEPAQLLATDEAPADSSEYNARQAQLFGMLENILNQSAGALYIPPTPEYDAGSGGLFMLSPGDFPKTDAVEYN